jgi:multiple sugar transport system substrate-binding protein
MGSQLSTTRLERRTLLRGLSAIPAGALLAACATSGSGSSAAPASSGTVATEDTTTPISLNFWTWGGVKPTAMVAAYKKLRPNITVNITEFGGTGPLYTKLTTVLKAGTGAPDLTGVELAVMPTYAAAGNFADVSEYGADPSLFGRSAVLAATWAGKFYALPTDTGPLVMYYRKDIFDKLGIAVPTTWAEYRSAAIKIKAAAPTMFMASIDPGDAGLPQALIWQAGGHPFTVTGTSDLTIDLADRGTKAFADYWSSMLAYGLINPEAEYTPNWFNELAKGTYATWITGAWGGSVLEGSIPQSNGKWRVAQLPNWSASAPANGIEGGSGTAVITGCAHKVEATAFAQWYGSQWPLVDIAQAATSTFPASEQVLTSPKYVSATSLLLGGQKPGALYLKAAATVSSGWQFLPYELYAGTIYKDTAGQHYSGKADLLAGLGAWQSQLMEYGNQQGFTVKA